MYIVKSRIENFDDCRVGDILYQDEDDQNYDWKLYTDQNRLVSKLKSRPVLPGGLVAIIEEKGLNIQTISVYDDTQSSWTTASMPVSGTLINWPQSASIVPSNFPPPSTYTGRKTGGTSAKIKPTPSKSKVVSNPIPISKFVGKSIGKLIRKIR